ncbi:hypothetical protein H0G86_005615 [Trichoderma simmonsii]|uniref:Uncharacterized protein n=1 Tax=Trichoderma simmonsii TaxID=1491479 RepID=A0A8G0L9X2_9HYPO|nr:hypothetical protein H0G86_005615 [Trichoderma simmonsii]
MPLVKKLVLRRWPHQLNTNDLSIIFISPELTLAAYSVAREGRHHHQPSRADHFGEQSEPRLIGWLDSYLSAYRGRPAKNKRQFAGARCSILSGQTAMCGNLM